MCHDPVRDQWPVSHRCEHSSGVSDEGHTYAFFGMEDERETAPLAHLSPRAPHRSMSRARRGFYTNEQRSREVGAGYADRRALSRSPRIKRTIRYRTSKAPISRLVDAEDTDGWVCCSRCGRRHRPLSHDHKGNQRRQKVARKEVYGAVSGCGLQSATACK